MRLPVENGKQTNQNDARGQGEMRGRGDEDTKCENRNHDALFAKRDLNSSHPEGAAERHDGNECQRDRPKRAPSHLCRPNADSDHGTKMVQSAERMPKAVRKPACVSNSHVSVRQARKEKQDPQRECGTMDC